LAFPYTTLFRSSTAISTRKNMTIFVNHMTHLVAMPMIVNESHIMPKVVRIRTGSGGKVVNGSTRKLVSSWKRGWSLIVMPFVRRYETMGPMGGGRVEMTASS